MKKNYSTLLLIFLITFAFAQNGKGVDQFTVSVTSENHYSPGTTMDLHFILDYHTEDWEYGDYISLTFPDGITPLGSPTDPIAITHEGQVECNLNGVEGQMISWGTNNNDGWGGIELGQHPFIVNVSIDAGVTGDQVIDILVSGAEYGNPQGDVNITCTVQELTSDSELGIIAAGIEYTNYPIAQLSSFPLFAEVSNFGADLTAATDVVVTCELASYAETAAITVPFATGESEFFAFPGINATEEGMHEIIFEANASGDPNPSNNYDTVTFGVDSVYAHDDNGRAFAYGTDNWLYSIGTPFDIIAEDDLTAVQFFLAESATIGDEFSLSVRPIILEPSGETFISEEPVWESEALYVDAAMLESWTTVNVESSVLLEEGVYGLFINQHNYSSIEIGHDGNPEGDILMSVTGNNYYWQDETYGWAMLRLVLGTPVSTDISESIYKEEISIFPNPSTGIVNIKNAENKNVNIYNILGMKIIEIDEASCMETIDISKYAPGTYIIEVGSQKETINLLSK